jgi:hypothetical protein
MAENELPDAPWATPQAAPSRDSDLPDAPWAAPTGRRVAFTPGQEKYAEDEALLAKNRGMVPDAAKAGLWSAGNTALLNAPRLASATYTSYAENKPLKQALKEQTEYEEALSRQHPTASKVGTGIGLVGGLAVPLGPVATLGKVAGAATAAKLGTTAGKIAEGATVGSTLSGASGFAGTLDPREALKDAAIGAGVGGVAAPVLGALGNYFTKLPAVRDANGELVPEVKQALVTAFGGRMSKEDIASFENELVAVFEKKGVSSDVSKNVPIAQEALLIKQGVTPTRSLVTGEAAPKVTEDIGARAAMEGAESIAKKAKAIAGTAPAPGEIAQALHGAEDVFHKAGTAAYDTVGQRVGTFKPETAKLFVPEMQQKLANNKFPITSEELARTNQYPQAAEAMKFIEEGLAAGNLPLVNPKLGEAQFDLANMNAVRKALNSYERSAKGADQAAVIQIKSAFDDVLNKALPSKLFSGDGKAAVAEIRKADALWADYKSTFYTPHGSGAPVFKAALKEMLDKQLNNMQTNLSQTSAETAQGILNTGLLNKKAGADLYDRMANSLRNDKKGMEAVKSQIRNEVLKDAGDLGKLSEALDRHLAENGAVMGKVFTKDQLADLRRLSETARIISARKIPQQEKDDLIAKAVGKAIRLGAAGLGQIFHGPMGAVIGYLGTHGAERVTEAISTGAKRRAEMAGAAMPRKAPEMLRAFDKAPSGASLVRNVEAVKPAGVEGYQEPTMLPPLTIRRDRTARASGGRISNKLVASVERAKKLVNNSTKPLLNADDTHIAKALEIANQNLEG